MAKRKPKVVGKRKSEEGNTLHAEHLSWEKSRTARPRAKTRREEVYDIIYDACRKGYHFTDTYYGIPFIELGDIEEHPGEIFVVRFRCEPRFMHEVYFGRMAKDVCKTLRTELRIVHERKQEWGIPFEECVWVLQPGEIPDKTPFHKEFYEGRAGEPNPFRVGVKASPPCRRKENMIQCLPSVTMVDAKAGASKKDRKESKGTMGCAGGASSVDVGQSGNSARESRWARIRKSSKPQGGDAGLAEGDLHGTQTHDSGLAGGIPHASAVGGCQDTMSQPQNNTSQAKPAPKKCTHERWNDFLTAKYGRTLLDVASELGYSEENLEILACDKNDKKAKLALYKKHKALFDAFLKTDCADLRDGRNPLDYFKDLIASWIGEDLLVKALNEYGFTAEVSNADKDRKIKSSKRHITCAADIRIEYEGNVRYLELMDALSPVEEYGQFDLRLAKARKQFEYGNLFLLQGLHDGKFVLIDFLRDSITVKYNAPHPRWGGKSSSLVNLEENGIKMHSMALLWETIKGVMLNTKPEQAHTLTLVDCQTETTETLTSGAVVDDDSSDYSESGDDCPSENEESAPEVRQVVEGNQEAEVAKPEPEGIIAAIPEEASVDLSDISDESEESDVLVAEEEAALPSQEEEQPPQEDEGFLEGNLGDLSNFC